MSIYTRAGDAGDTTTHAGKRVRKDDPLVEAYGTLDELNSFVGLAIANSEGKHTKAVLLRVQKEIFCLGACIFSGEMPVGEGDVKAIEKALGREPQRDWNAVWSRIEDLLHERKSRWKATEQKLFRSVFTQKDSEAELVAKGGRDDGYEPDSDLRDFENVPLKDDVDAYYEREVRPHVPDAWMDRSKDKVGYEINFNRHFYKYTPPRPLEEIDADLKRAEDEIMRLLREVTS